VYVGPGALVGNRVHVGSHSRIGGGAVIGHGVRLHGDSTVAEGSYVTAGTTSAGSSQRSHTRDGRKARKAA
jgi:UDP-3-O-[3-hydroxymyristoyl] glucosamine N-acyltransferase